MPDKLGATDPLRPMRGPLALRSTADAAPNDTRIVSTNVVLTAGTTVSVQNPNVYAIDFVTDPARRCMSIIHPAERRRSSIMARSRAVSMHRRQAN